MSKDSSTKYYQDNKETLQEKACERYQSLCRKKKRKSNNMIANNIKISKKMKSKG